MNCIVFGIRMTILMNNNTQGLGILLKLIISKMKLKKKCLHKPEIMSGEFEVNSQNYI